MQRQGNQKDPARLATSGLRKVNLGRHLLSTYNKPGKENVEETEDYKPSEPEPTIEQLPVSSDDEGELSELNSADFGSEPKFASPDQEEQESEPQREDNNGPATDDDPVSYDEDEDAAEDSDSQRPKKRALETYDQNPKGRDRDDNNDAFDMWSSQSFKRAKTRTFSRTPSNVRTQATPEKSSPQTKSQTFKAQGKKKAGGR